MAITSPELEAIQVRNQVILERLKEGEHKKFAPFLKRIEKDLRIKLSNEGETIRNKKRLNALLADVKMLQKDIYADYNKQLFLDLGEVGIQQAGFEAKSYEAVTVDYNSSVPNSAQVLTAIRVNPMQMADYAGNQLLEPFIKDWSDAQIQRVSNTITQGFYQGQTTAQITKNIRGTRKNKYNDGELAKINRSNKTIVRTALQSASTQARMVTMKDNDDLIKGYQWVSTLDSRTSNQCTALDGMKFKVGQGALPPIHPNCRSTTTPLLSEKFSFLDKGATRASIDGGTSQKDSYFTWLKRQPVAFQNEAIGVKRAKLLRDGGLSSAEFAKLSLNKNFQALTLEEMHRIQPSIFELAKVEI